MSSPSRCRSRHRRRHWAIPTDAAPPAQRQRPAETAGSRRLRRTALPETGYGPPLQEPSQGRTGATSGLIAALIVLAAIRSITNTAKRRRSTSSCQSPKHGHVPWWEGTRVRLRPPFSRPHYSAAAARACSLSPITRPSGLAVILTVAPSAMPPSRMRCASGFCSSRWITRFSGRAP